MVEIDRIEAYFQPPEGIDGLTMAVPELLASQSHEALLAGSIRYVVDQISLLKSLFPNAPEGEATRETGIRYVDERIERVDTPSESLETRFNSLTTVAAVFGEHEIALETMSRALKLRGLNDTSAQSDVAAPLNSAKNIEKGIRADAEGAIRQEEISHRIGGREHQAQHNLARASRRRIKNISGVILYEIPKLQDRRIAEPATPKEVATAGIPGQAPTEEAEHVLIAA